MAADPEVDLMSGELYAGDPEPVFAWMRRHAPVYRDRANGLWGISRYHDVKAASTDTATFSSAGGVRPKFPPLPMMIDFDAPEHVRRRRLVSAGFTPARVRQLRQHVGAVCDLVLDAVCEQGRCDFVSDIAAPLPLQVIGDLLGVAPEDRAALLHWSEVMLLSQGGGGGESGGQAGGGGGRTSDQVMADAMAAFGEYTSYIGPVIEERRRTGRDDDLIGVLCHAELDGERLDHDTLVHETLLILIGGDETTRHVLSGGFLALLEHPAQLAALRADPSLVGTAVEEMLRWVSPVKNMARTATRDVELAGSRIAAGDEVLLLYPSANRDDTVFDQPGRFDITRNPNPHLAFGFGAHFCLGNQLARLELAEMTERVMRRCGGLALDRADGGSLPRQRANFITGLESMPVTFTPGPRLGAGAGESAGSAESAESAGSAGSAG